MSSEHELVGVLRRNAGSVRPVLPFDLRRLEPVVFDFTEGNRGLARVDLNDTAGFADALFREIEASGSPLGIGRYDEDRVVYRHSPLFDGRMERRSVHLGIDLFVEAETPVFSPFPGVVHSFCDNNNLGDYGPTVILEHELSGVVFYTLYGHLSRASLDDQVRRRRLAAGEQLGAVGGMHENGSWPPHLHFQVIADMQGHEGDYPGVAMPSERHRFLELCPDPNLILGLQGV